MFWKRIQEGTLSSTDTTYSRGIARGIARGISRVLGNPRGTSHQEFELRPTCKLRLFCLPGKTYATL